MAKMRKRAKARKKGYSEYEKLANKIGKIQRGLANRNSKVYASYMNGYNGKPAKDKKPMF